MIKIATKNAKIEYEIKKSKFISYLYCVSSLEEIKQIIDNLKKEYCDATHICYGYVVCENGIKEKAVDDGEPSGTAGKPILDCIKKHNLVNTLIVVIRYFGGIKLGAGGLIRAYNQSAKEVINSVKDYIVNYVEFEEEELKIEYNKFGEFKNFCEKNNVIILSSNFGKNICVKIKKAKGSEINFDSYKNWSAKKQQKQS